jgi:tetratricopeptide (TPR) repeat protein
MYNEGFAYRLLPLVKAAAADSTQQQPELVNTDAMYDHMMNKFTWGNLNTTPYLDPESVRMVAVLVNNFNILAEGLYNEGRTEEAKKVLAKCLSVLPERNFSLNFTIRKYYMADLLYKLKETQKANKLVENTADYINAQLNYLYAISQTKENLGAQEIQLGMSILNELVKVTAENGQTALNKDVEGKYKALESKFIGNR